MTFEQEEYVTAGYNDATTDQTSELADPIDVLKVITVKLLIGYDQSGTGAKGDKIDSEVGTEERNDSTEDNMSVARVRKRRKMEESTEFSVSLVVTKLISVSLVVTKLQSLKDQVVKNKKGSAKVERALMDMTAQITNGGRRLSRVGKV